MPKLWDYIRQENECVLFKNSPDTSKSLVSASWETGRLTETNIEEKQSRYSWICVITQTKQLARVATIAGL